MRVFSLDRTLKIIIIIFLILNLMLLARMLGEIYLPGEVTSLERAKQGAQSVVDYSEKLADSYGVDSKNLRNTLAKFEYEIEKAGSSEEVASLMVDYGRQLQDIIFQEVQNKRINKALNIINSQQLPEEGNITISDINGEIRVVDPRGVLNRETISRLKQLNFKQTIELKINDSTARLLTDEGLFNQVDYLQTKLASLERQLNTIKKKAGYEEITGPGIEIRVYDESENVQSSGIVHDSDIRNIINELFIAGARGIEVGEQRLTSVSPIRCVGPTILVNNKPISVNPVVIRAVGQPKVLASSLEIVKKQIQVFGIKIEVEQKQEINLGKQSLD